MVYCFDIDGTLCTQTDGRYEDARPFLERIVVVNALYDAGHTIKLFTARGTVTGFDWRAVTVRQLSEWQVKYHQLLFGKPEADIFVDDRAVNADAWAWKHD